VIRAAATKPFGFVPYYPGPGLGGHCIPIDPFYLTWKARQYGVDTRFIELAGEVNAAMPEWVVGKMADALAQRSKTVRGSRILVLGIAYKKNIDDMRESPAVEIMELLRARGAHVSYSDPHVPKFPKSLPLTAQLLASQDCVIVATDHDAFDYALIAAHAPLVVDTRGRYPEARGNIVKA
jgi:UDP-N-acetyl-D-glucosamine dehydrogenase